MAEIHNAPIVLDNGSGTIRAGFAGEDLPKCYFPSFVGRPKHLRVLAGALEGDVFIGQRAQELRGLLKIKYPLEHGIVTDWDDMERIWQYVYQEELKTMSEEVCVFRNSPSDAVCSCRWQQTASVISLPPPPPPSFRSDSRLYGLIKNLIPAPCPPNRTTPQPPNKPGHRRPNPLRNLQRPRPLPLHPSRPLPLRLRANNRHRPRQRRWSLTRSARLRGVFHPVFSPANRRCGPRCDGTSTTPASEERVCVSYERGEGGCAYD